VLRTLLPGLNPLCERIILQIAAQDAETTEYCKNILQSITLAFRPLQLKELAATTGLPRDQFSDIQAVVDLISRCDSFLTIRKGIVSFIHLSAKNLFTLGNSRQVSNSPLEEEQRQITYYLLDAIDSTLQRDIYSLQKPSIQIQKATGRVWSYYL